MTKPKLLFCASEGYPFAKSGGLADVVFSLPKILTQEYSLRVVLPLYQSIDRAKFGIVLCEEKVLLMGGISYKVSFYECQYEGVSYSFVYEKSLCDREFLYGTSEQEYTDNPLRFGIFKKEIRTRLQLSLPCNKRLTVCAVGILVIVHI